MIENDEVSASGSEDVPFSSSPELHRLAIMLVGNARRQLDIVSRSLEPQVFGSAEFIEAVKKLALTQGSRVRILVLDPASLLAHGGHRLVELAMRVSSHMEIRRPGLDQAEFNESMMIADRVGVIHRKNADRYEGIANFHAPRWAARLSEDFEPLWQNAEADPNFRRLML